MRHTKRVVSVRTLEMVKGAVESIGEGLEVPWREMDLVGFEVDPPGLENRGDG